MQSEITITQSSIPSPAVASNFWRDQTSTHTLFLRSNFWHTLFSMRSCLGGGRRRSPNLQRASAVADACVKMFARRYLKEAWASWVEAHAERIQQTRLLTKATSSLKSPASAAWRQWAHVSRQRTQQLETLKRGMQKLLHQELTRGLGAWTEMAHDRAAFLLALRRGLSKLVSRSLALAIEAWREAFSASSDIARAMGHLLNRQLSRGFASWADAHAQRLRLRQCVGFFLHQTLTRGWMTLSTWWSALHARQVLISADIVKCEGAFRRMRNRQLARGFATWAQAADTQAASYDSLLHGLSFFTNRELARGWVSWVGFAVERSEQLAMVRTGLSHLTHSVLGRGWRAWEEMASNRGACLLLMRQGASFLANRALAVGFASWREGACERADDPVARAMRFGLDPRLQACGRGWRVWAATAAERAKHHELLGRSVRHMANRSLALAWTAWVDTMQVQAMMQRGLNRMVHIHTARGFISWRGLIEQRREHLQLLKQGASFLCNCALSVGFGTWREVTKMHGALSESMRRGVVCLSNNTLARGWSSWASWSLERARTLASLQRDWMRMLDIQFSRGFNAWVDMAAERAEKLRCLRKGMRFMLNRNLAQGMAAWQLAADAARDDPMGRALRHLLHRQQSIAWAAWGGPAMHRRLIEQRMRKGLARV